MGMPESHFNYMIEQVPRVRLGRACVTLGKQQVYIRPERALELAADAGLFERDAAGGFRFPADHPFPASYVSGSTLLSFSDPAGMITDVALMKLLGFAEVRSIDVSAYEGADIVMDLNDPTAARRHGRKFELVLDSGTVEHVFHVPNALKNVFDLLETGGCVLHFSPANNFVDHGFYQFSPTLYYDYYAANGFTILDCKFQQLARNINAPCKMTPYSPGSLDGISFGGLDGGMYGVAMLARKNPESTWDVIPQQSHYARLDTWQSRRGLPGSARP